MCRLCTHIATVNSCSFTVYVYSLYTQIFCVYQISYVPAVDTSISTADIYLLYKATVCLHAWHIFTPTHNIYTNMSTLT